MPLVKDPATVHESRGQEDAPASLIISYLLMRVLIGVIAVLLPFVLILANWAIGHGVQHSMSGYYYTPMRNIFVGALCAIGVFLVAYDGYDWADRTITDFTGPGQSQARPWERLIYRVSGGVIAVCVILVSPLSTVAAYSLLVLETIMLVAFGLSWFVKGRKIRSGG